MGVAALEALRIAEAIPAYGIDIAERDLPQETSQMRTLSFSKGCYQGQESSSASIRAAAFTGICARSSFLDHSPPPEVN